MVDANTKEPLAYVNIGVQEAGIGTVSDEEGLFHMYLEQDKIVYQIFNECYFEPGKVNNLNFFQLVDGVDQQKTMQEYVDFLDSVKLIHDD